MLTKYFARYLAGSGVTVNAIAPGPIDTAKARLSPEQIARSKARCRSAASWRWARSRRPPPCSPRIAGLLRGGTLDMNGGLYLR
jgi:3-oxoacyl-[acyl-carrier protein] reductase